MKKSKMLFALSASLVALPAAANMCQVANPVYWGCLAAVKCLNADVFGSACGMSNEEFCNSLSDEKKLAIETGKVVAKAYACKEKYAVIHISQALGEASKSCFTSQGSQVNTDGPKKTYCKVVTEAEKYCPKPEYYDICPDIPWLPKNPMKNLPSPTELATKALGEAYKAVSGATGGQKMSGTYTGQDPTYMRELTANYVNATMIAAASGDFTSVGLFVRDVTHYKPPPNMYLEGLRSAVAKMTPQDLSEQVKAVALAIENPMPREADRKPGNLGMTLHDPRLWKEIAQANWSNPLAAAAAIGTHYRASNPHLSVTKVAESLNGSNAGPLGALVVAEFMRAGYRSELKVGERLRSDEGLMSQNGKYYLYMPPDGCNLLWFGPGMYGGIEAWRKDWKGQTCELVQQGDGNLVIYRKDGKPLWSTLKHGLPHSGYVTVLQDDGNVATYADANINHRTSPAWHAGTFKCKQHVRYWDKSKEESVGARSYDEAIANMDKYKNFAYCY